MITKIPVVFYVLPLASLFAGIWLSWHFLRGQIELRRASSWPVVDGSVVACSLDVQPGQRRADVTAVSVSYEYTVAGHSYTGTRVHPTYAANAQTEAHEKLAARLAVGSPVSVHFLPSDPKQAYLAVGQISSGWLPLVVGMVFCAAGVAFGAAFWLVNYGNYDYASLIGSP